MRRTRRKGDRRAHKRIRGVALTLTPDQDHPFRWLPRHGEPYCLGEWVTQHAARGLAWFPLYATVWMIAATVVWFVSQ